MQPKLDCALTPRVVSVERRSKTPSQLAAMRAATACMAQREARGRREAKQIVAAAEAPAPTVWEDLQAVRRRPPDAAMASRHQTAVQPPAALPLDPPQVADPVCGPETRYDIDAGDTGVGRFLLAALLAAAAFLAGMAAGRWA